MSPRPGGPVPRDIGQVSCGKREQVQTLHQGSGGRSNNRAAGCARQRRRPGFQWDRSRVVRQCLDQLQQRPLRFAEKNEVGASVEVSVAVIGSVGSVNHDFCSARTRGIDHCESNVAHPAQTHFGEEVEVVFVDRDNARSVSWQAPQRNPPPGPGACCRTAPPRSRFAAELPPRRACPAEDRAASFEPACGRDTGDTSESAEHRSQCSPCPPG